MELKIIPQESTDIERHGNESETNLCRKPACRLPREVKKNYWLTSAIAGVQKLVSEKPYSGFIWCWIEAAKTR